MENWVGKIAVITGSSNGIGLATAKEFLSKGINVIGLDIEEDDKNEIKKNSEEKCGNFFYLHCNIADLNEVKKTFKKIEEKFQFVHILVNCAGISRNLKMMDESDETTEKINEVINVNFTGLVHCTREAIKLIKKSNDFGLIVNICSIVGHYVPFLPISENVLAATKHAVRAFSEQLRQELVIEGNAKIRVSNISPGTTRTNIETLRQFDESFFESFPILRPEDVSQSISFVLQTPTTVNISQITVKPVGERF
jgi:NADP-dependent 3-hydroxy acid dehydrogenase YdfG